MNYRILLFVIPGFLLMNCFFATAQKDEKYYYKLGKKYVFMKDYDEAAKIFYKCLDIAVSNDSENPNYYYYPALMFYYGHGKSKQVLRAMDLITDWIPEAPNTPKEPDTKKEKYFLEFFNAERIQIDKADYIFLRYFIQFKTGDIEIIDAFDRLEYAVRYHDPEASVVPIVDIFQLMVDMYTKFYAESPDPESYYKEYLEKVCNIFKDASDAGNNDALSVVNKSCK